MERARAEVPQVLSELNLWVGLNFVEGIKGKKRRVRRLAGGVVAFGEMPLRGALEAPPAQEQIGHGTDAGANEKADRMVRSASCRREGISFTKVNRGDGTPVELFVRDASAASADAR